MLLSFEEDGNLDPTPTQAFFLLIFSSSRVGSVRYHSIDRSFTKTREKGSFINFIHVEHLVSARP